MNRKEITTRMHKHENNICTGSEKRMSNSLEIVEIKRSLEISDLSMARIVEDLIHILVQRGSIKYSDLSDESRNKLKEREELRAELRILMKSAKR